MTTSIQRGRRGAAARGAHLLPSPREGLPILSAQDGCGTAGSSRVQGLQQSHMVRANCPTYSTQPRCPQPSGAGSKQKEQRGGNQGAGEKGRQGGTPQARGGERHQAAGCRQGQRRSVSLLPNSHQTILPQTPTWRNTARLCAKGRKPMCAF